MRLATFTHDGQESFGLVKDAGLVDVPALWPGGPRNLLEALAGGHEVLKKIGELAAGADKSIPLREAEVLAPIPAPPKVIGLAVNYVEHHRECSRGPDMPDDPRRTTTPRPFIMPATAVIGPGAEIPWPVYSRQLDYEVELAVVIGRQAKCVSPEQAAPHIAGYTIANDISARSVTHAEGRAERPKDAFFDWLHGKWSDGLCPMGPHLVTADEIADPQNLTLELAVNGEVRQQASTSQMIFNVIEIVSFLSHIMTLVPGDVIATGTPSGVAAATGNFLAPADVITCRIEQIGELTNTIGPQPRAFYAPCGRAETGEQKCTKR